MTFTDGRSKAILRLIHLKGQSILVLVSDTHAIFLSLKFRLVRNPHLLIDLRDLVFYLLFNFFALLHLLRPVNEILLKHEA